MLSILERKKEKKNMNIYEFMNTIPDYVSNPLTAINVMIMISSLKDKFKDKIHETAREGYLAMQDMSPSKYYKLYLWYWCDKCTYGIRECTAKDFNIKEEEKMDVSKMTKEEALKKINELKAYVEKCEEQEIPEMVRTPVNRDQNAIVCPQVKNDKITAWLTFEKDDTSLCWAALAYELAQLLYCREYLGAKNTDIREARAKGSTVFCISHLSDVNKYVVIEIEPLMTLRPNELVWCFIDNLDAHRVCDYMNKYVADIKKNMF